MPRAPAVCMFRSTQAFLQVMLLRQFTKWCGGTVILQTLLLRILLCSAPKYCPVNLPGMRTIAFIWLAVWESVLSVALIASNKDNLIFLLASAAYKIHFKQITLQFFTGMFKKLKCYFPQKDESTEYLLVLDLRHSAEDPKSGLSAAGRLAQFFFSSSGFACSIKTKSSRMDLLNGQRMHCTHQCTQPHPAAGQHAEASIDIHRYWCLWHSVLASTALIFYINEALQCLWVMGVFNVPIFFWHLAFCWKRMLGKIKCDPRLANRMQDLVMPICVAN